MDDRGNIRELSFDERPRENEIEVTSVRGQLETMTRNARRVYWKAIRRGASTEQALKKAMTVRSGAPTTFA